jgi:hypothetical protein
MKCAAVDVEAMSDRERERKLEQAATSGDGGGDG